MSSAAPPTVKEMMRLACNSLVLESSDATYATVMNMCFTVFYTIRQLIIQPYYDVTFSSTAPKLDLHTLMRVWDDRVESKLVQSYGAIVSSDGPSAAKSKSCGPFVHVCTNEWKQRLSSNSGLKSIVDLIESAFASARMAEFHTRYADSFLPGNGTFSIPKKLKSIELIGHMLQLFFQQWVTNLRAMASVKIVFTTPACLADFQTLLQMTNKPFAALYETIQPKTLPSLSHGTRISINVDMTAKSNSTLLKLESWVMQTFPMKSGKEAFATAAADGDAKYYLCRYSACFSRDGMDILPGTKYVTVRCSEGCASTYHLDCYHDMENSFVAISEDGGGGIACTRREDRKCDGWIGAAILKQDGKVLSYLVGEGLPSEAMDDEDDDETDAADGSSSSSSSRVNLSGSALTNAVAHAGASQGIEVIGRRFRNQKSAKFWANQPRAELRRIQVVDGTVLYSDELERTEDSLNRQQKRLKEEERRKEAALRSQREEEERRRRLQKEKEEEEQQKSAAAASASAAATTAMTTTTTAKKKMTSFEVVVRATPETPKSKPPIASSSSSVPVSRQPASTPTPLVNVLTPWGTISTVPLASASPHAIVNMHPSVEEDENDGFTHVINVKKEKKKVKASAASSMSPEIYEDAYSNYFENRPAKESFNKAATNSPPKMASTTSTTTTATAAVVAAAKPSNVAMASSAPSSSSSPSASISTFTPSASTSTSAPSSSAAIVHGRTMEEIREGRRLKKEAKLKAREEAKLAAEAERTEQHQQEQGLENQATLFSEEKEELDEEKDDHDDDYEDDDRAPGESMLPSSLTSTSGQDLSPPRGQSSVVASAVIVASVTEFDECKESSESLSSSMPTIAPGGIQTMEHAIETASVVVQRTSVQATTITPAIPTSSPAPSATPSASSSSAPSHILAPTPLPTNIAQPSVTLSRPPSLPSHSTPQVSITPSPLPTPMSIPLRSPTPLMPSVSPMPTSTPNLNPSFPMIDDIACAPSGVATSSILLRHLPARVTVQMLGSVFRVFGSLRVQFFFTCRHGLVGVCHYQTVEAAQSAINTMTGRAYELQTPRQSIEGEYSENDTWMLDEIVYAATPLQPIPVPIHRKLKLVAPIGQPALAPIADSPAHIAVGS